MSAPNQTSLRLQLGLPINPPAYPVDLNTGEAPRAWTGATLVVDVAVFDPVGASVDLSNLARLEVDIFPVPGNNEVPESEFNYNPYSPSPFPNLPPAPLIFQTVEADDIEATVPLDEFQAGNAQQARATFPWAMMAQLELNGRPSRAFWIVVIGQTDEGVRIPYGAAILTVYASGSTGIYLQNNLAPLVVPDETILYVGPNQQMPFSEPIDIEGTVVDDGILVQS